MIVYMSVEYSNSGCCFQAEDGIRDQCVTGVQTCGLPISSDGRWGQVMADEGKWWQVRASDDR